MPRYAPVFQVIKTVGGVTDTIRMSDTVKEKLDKPAAQDISNFWPSDAVRASLVLRNNSLRVWCNEMRRLNSQQLKSSLNVSNCNELEELAIYLLQYVRTINGCLNTDTKATRAPSTGPVQL